MSDVPDDIRAAARHAFEEARVMSIFDTQVDIIARALMAERARCLKIVEDWELVERILPLADDSHNEAALTGQNEASERIAAAIRRGDR